ncbi:UTP-monosaccharide-1-phosphate uridylyltransferase [Plasmodiophora brassicae]
MTQTMTTLPDPLQANLRVLAAAEAAAARALVDAGQAHLFEHWPAPGQNDDDKKRLLAQAADLDAKYPGGIKTYADNARALLKASCEGVNPYAGYTPAVPLGVALRSNTPELDDFEGVGVASLAYTAFVLVAGGLGERLGYQGIKISLPSEIVTEAPYIELYVQYILAYQARARQATGRQDLILPLAIMTSDDTHEQTVALLDKFARFGLAPGQVRIVKQEKVPALIDNDARIALSASDPYLIETKPHGHGDVHTLLHQHGVVADWVARHQTKHVFFFQDTNAAVFRAFPAALGVSVKKQFEVNSITVPRKPGEAVGAICRLNSHEGQRSLTINVEYNQLEPLLRATISPDGDVPDATGFSPFPGNINALIFAAEPYLAVLKRTNGGVPEFVNPKYKDKTKTTFKAPTRLECMMQDYPRLLGPDAKVGFTQLERWMAFAAVKNNVADGLGKFNETGFSETAAEGESNLYAIGANLLRLGGDGVRIPQQTRSATFAGIPTMVGPKVVLRPSFGVTQAEIRSKVQGASIDLSASSTLLLSGSGVTIKKLQLDGALVVKAGDGTSIALDNVVEKNAGWQFQAVPTTYKDQRFAIRGYTLDKRAQRVIEADDLQAHRINDPAAAN